MSAVSGSNAHAEADFEYWEFVHCTICFLPFISDPANAPNAPPSVPFWLTECGHVVCNNHLNADQSCARCRAQSIQLVPLQRDMIPPMSDWFRSVPHGLDTLANAAKFQQDTMASLIRFYKRKCYQQRAAISKARDAVVENKALRSQIEQLQRENEHLRAGAGTPANQHFEQRFALTPNRHSGADESLVYEPSYSRNANGKRPLTNAHQHQRTSSPRSTITPIAPPRLTLPPDHQQPVFPSGMSTASRGEGHRTDETHSRPGSSRFEQYAFQPPATPFRAQPLRHHQQVQGHRRQQEAQEDRQQQHRQQVQGQTQQQAQERQQKQQSQPQQRMLPPPTPSGSHGTTNASQHQSHARALFRPVGQVPPQNVRRPQVQIQPSPAPTATKHQTRALYDLQARPFPMSIPTPAPTARTSSSSSRFPSANTATDRRYAIPPTPSNSNRFFTPRAVGGIDVGTSRTQAYQGAITGGSTRTPFVPGTG